LRQLIACCSPLKTFLSFTYVSIHICQQPGLFPHMEHRHTYLTVLFMYLSIHSPVLVPALQCASSSAQWSPYCSPPVPSALSAGVPDLVTAGTQTHSKTARHPEGRGSSQIQILCSVIVFKGVIFLVLAEALLLVIEPVLLTAGTQTHSKTARHPGGRGSGQVRIWILCSSSDSSSA
jgi:hypothetical protein